MFGHTGAFDWNDAVRLCLAHRLHPSFFVRKLWSYFVPVPPGPRTQAELVRLYAGQHIRPVGDAILLDDAFYRSPMMVKPPVVFTAGMLRGIGRAIDTEDWVGYADATGQRLFAPPNVSGWQQDRWLDTSTYRGRWDSAVTALGTRVIDPAYPPHSHGPERPAQVLRKTRHYLGEPLLSAEAEQLLLSFTHLCCAAPAESQAPALRAMGGTRCASGSSRGWGGRSTAVCRPEVAAMSARPAVMADCDPSPA